MEKIFADTVKVIEMGDYYPGLSGWALNAIINVLLIKGRFDTEEEKSCDHAGQDCSDVTISQEMAAATRRWKRQGIDSTPEPP